MTERTPDRLERPGAEVSGAWAQSLALSFRFLFLLVFLLGAGWFVSTNGPMALGF